MDNPAAPPERQGGHGSAHLTIAWACVLLGAAALAWGYERAPEVVTLYRPPWLDAPITAPRSPLTVGRIAAIGAAQLLAATAMTSATQASPAWSRFWRGLAMVAGAKTLLECLTILTLPGSLAERSLTAAMLLSVGVFVAAHANHLWSAPPHPPVTGPQRAWLGGALALWAVSAVGPALLR
jgi:hypothetical protein